MSEVPETAPPRFGKPKAKRVRVFGVSIRLPKGSLVLTVFTGISVVLGYAREGVIAYFFGTTGEVDAFIAAFTLPRLLVALVTTVSVSALLPVYVGHLRRGEEGEARAVVRSWFVFATTILAAVCVVLGAFPEGVLRFLVPGFDAAQLARAAGLLRGLTPYVFLAGAAATYKVVLDSHQRFTAPALGRALVTVLVIGTVIAAASRLGVWALVLGYGLGGALFFGIHVWSTRGVAAGFALRDLGRPILARLPLAGVGWLLLQTMLGQLFSIFDRIFASGLETGSIAALSYGIAIVTAPQNFLTSVLATALFPVLAGHVAEGKPRVAFRETVKWLGLLWVLMTPLVALIIYFRVELVALLLQRGAFGARSTMLVASVLAVLPATIVLGGSNAITNRLLLSFRAYRFLALMAGLTGALKLLLNFLFVGPLGVMGLALASVLCGAFGFACRLLYVWRRSSISPGDGPPPPPPLVPPVPA